MVDNDAVTQVVIGWIHNMKMKILVAGPDVEKLIMNLWEELWVIGAGSHEIEGGLMSETVHWS
jgi:SHS2 domain-containing protein